MKSAFLATLLLTTTLASAPVFAQEESNNQTRFFCAETLNSQTQKRVPTTVYWTPNFKKQMVIWTSVLAGYKPQERCQKVSDNFQVASNNGSLNYITNAVLNGSKVICSVRSTDGACDTVLFTLRSQDSSKEVLNQLNLLIYGPATSTDSIQQSSGGEPKFYIDIRQFLNTPPSNKIK
ncbi:COP23 domain-containing protein [Sphaerospermopsis aphanizomenoides BCCUSP55]|uniref:COP23 domain-containing protein n=1 Tax=Sphaerospermopsis aphanizomenoides TaxID=459663 RepID=UPI001907E698|nr:COP23 domain-containing protein [Sphaerospermopsis aphanizomenoides]MBK1987337.1 COP23 domain-containing protein [Sphaerospermopsis aphanizomenoides BCCUSP55]